jgi:endonuclease/exonuclease/phosphatase family metal-dependent hydrolase
MHRVSTGIIHLSICSQMRVLRLFFLLAITGLITGLQAQNFTLLTWNIQDLGQSKEDAEIRSIAEIINEFDIIAVQEVVAKDPRGAQAVARIADELNRMGDRWDYRVSDPTRSPSVHISERYAFFWRASKIQLIGRPYLDRELEDECYREPYLAQFRLKSGGSPFFVVNFHSRTHDDRPEEEITYFQAYQYRLASELVFLAGDFNLSEDHAVWAPFYELGYQPSLFATPTTLKRKCARGNYLNHSIDNIYYDEDVIELHRSGRVDFVEDCELLEARRGLSDHLPVFLECRIK